MPRPLRSLLLVLILAVAAHAETIRVGAAVSLKDAFDALAKTYQADTGDTLEFSYGSSGQIAAQIKSGAPIDVFVSAANKQVDELTKDGLLDASTRRVVAGNRLVLIVPHRASDKPEDRFAPNSFESLRGGSGRVAVGEPKSVPAGQYAQQVFGALKLDDALKGRLVYGTNVRQVLAYVERGEVAAGVVYATDAKASGDKVTVVATAAANTHEPIVYPAALVLASPHHEDAARKFLDVLATPRGRDALTAAGFTVPAADAAKP